MAVNTPGMSQKEYLKKYLSKPTKKKKKVKVSSSTFLKRSVIIDDDLGLSGVASIDDEEFNLDYLGDEAPQIAGVIDERPPEVKAKENYGDIRKWKSLDKPGEDDLKIIEKTTSQGNKQEENNRNNLSDLSPARLSSRADNKDLNKNGKLNKIKMNSQEKESKKRESNSDNSPPHSSRFKQSERKTNRDKNDEYDSDLSPQRDRKSIHPSRKNSEFRKKESQEENTLKRRAKNYGSDSDMSPPRKSKNDIGFNNRNFSRKERSSNSSLNKDCDSDLSPRRTKDSAASRMIKNSLNYRDGEKYNKRHKSPSHQRHHKGMNSNSDRRDYQEKISYDKYKHRSKEEKKRNYSSESRTKKMEKTLDGKKAGLQSATNLTDELTLLKTREDEMYKEMSKSFSGQGAIPILRDRKTGKKRDIMKEKKEEQEKASKLAEQDMKYYKWGKGLKQVEDNEKRITDALHEMSKPLARYANDEDLDSYLKAQEREGDPMLEYFRKKQTEAINCENPAKPKYTGPYLPNRFGIPPGHRWDGVDRSSGYEKQWFEAKNAKKAVEEEAYKWSTSDM